MADQEGVSDEMLPEDQPWRKGLHDFSEKNLNELKDYVELYEPLEVIPARQARILLVGQIGAGKSSLFNTINSIYKGYVTAQAASGTDPDSLTTQYRTYEVRSGRRGQPMNFRLCDTMGLEEAEKGLDITDFYYFLDGYVPDSFQFKSGERLAEHIDLKKNVDLKDKIHVLAIVINAMNVGFVPEDIQVQLREIRRNALKRAIPVIAVLTHIDNVSEAVKADITKVYHSRAVWESVKKAAQIVGMPASQVIPMKNYETETELDRGVDILALFAVRQMIRLADSYFDEQMNKLGITLPKQGVKVKKEEPKRDPHPKMSVSETSEPRQLSGGDAMSSLYNRAMPLPSAVDWGMRRTEHDDGSRPTNVTPNVRHSWDERLDDEERLKYTDPKSGKTTQGRPTITLPGLAKTGNTSMSTRTTQPGDDTTSLPTGWEMVKTSTGEVIYVHESGKLTKDKPMADAARVAKTGDDKTPLPSGPAQPGDDSTSLPTGWEMLKSASGVAIYVHESGKLSNERPMPDATGARPSSDSATSLPPGWEMVTNAKGDVMYVHESGTMTKEMPMPEVTETPTAENDAPDLPTGWEMVKSAKGEVMFVHETGKVTKERPAPEPTRTREIGDGYGSLPTGWDMVTNAKGTVMYVHESGTVTKDRPIVEPIGTPTAENDAPDLPTGWEMVKSAKGEVMFVHETGKVTKERPAPEPTRTREIGDGYGSLPTGWDMVTNAKGTVMYVHESGTVTKDRPIVEPIGATQTDNDTALLPDGWEMVKNAKGTVMYIHESGTVTKEKPMLENTGIRTTDNVAASLPIGWEVVTNAKGDVMYIHESGKITKERPAVEAASCEKKSAGDPEVLPAGWERVKNAKGGVMYVHESGTVAKERPLPETTCDKKKATEDPEPLPPGCEMVKNAKGDIMYVHESGTVTKERPLPESTCDNKTMTEDPLHLPQGVKETGNDSSRLPDCWEMVKNAKGIVMYIHESGSVTKEKPLPEAAGIAQTEDATASLPKGWEMVTSDKCGVLYIHESGEMTKEKPVVESASDKKKEADEPQSLPTGWEMVKNAKGDTMYVHETGKMAKERPMFETTCDKKMAEDDPDQLPEGIAPNDEFVTSGNEHQPVGQITSHNEGLAPDWQVATTPEGRVYYYNRLTGTSSWEKPIGNVSPMPDEQLMEGAQKNN